MGVFSVELTDLQRRYFDGELSYLAFLKALSHLYANYGGSGFSEKDAEIEAALHKARQKRMSSKSS